MRGMHAAAVDLVSAVQCLFHCVRNGGEMRRSGLGGMCYFVHCAMKFGVVVVVVVGKVVCHTALVVL